MNSTPPVKYFNHPAAASQTLISNEIIHQKVSFHLGFLFFRDRKRKNFVGANGNVKKIRTESGVRIPATYKKNMYPLTLTDFSRFLESLGLLVPCYACIWLVLLVFT